MAAGYLIWLILMRKRSFAKDLPTRKAGGVVLGPNEVVAWADPRQTVVSPNAGVTCVYWREDRF